MPGISLRAAQFALAAILLLAACDSTPVTDRRQLIMLTKNQERQLGAQTAREILATARLSQDPEQLSLVREVASKLAAASGAKDMDWEFFVIDDAQTPNAFCLPGGKIFVSSGIFKYARTRDQLATVIAHEIAHALARHGAERASWALASELGGLLLNLALGDEDPRVRQLAALVWGYGAQLGVMLPYSRKHEYEADHIGLVLMKQAGYDPGAAVDFWENMRQAERGPRPPGFLLTHPTDEKRIERIREALKRMDRPDTAA